MRQLPFDINDKIKQDLQTIGNNADPKMQVVVARAKSSIQDSSYFTVENIRTKAGLTDISVAIRRQKAYGPPNGLFELHIDNGYLKAAERAYPDKLNLKWQNRPNAVPLVQVKSVAITFDGWWERYRKLWQLVTVEYPTTFWVENDGKLYTQIWGESSTLKLLAEEVVKVKAVRGWKNVVNKSQDTGVIAAYIKSNGKVYYRNYCDYGDGTKAWENEREITEFIGVAVNLNLFLTNDYRTGIMIEDNLGGIHWIITYRNWAGMGIAPEKFNVSANASVNFIPVNYLRRYEIEKFNCTASANIALLFGTTNNEFTQIGNIENIDGDWGWIIRFKVKNKSETMPIVVLTDVTTNANIAFIEVVESSPKVYDVIISNIVESGINNIEGDIKLNVTGLVNEAGYNYVNLEQAFTPINLIPVEIPLPEVEAIWNE